MHFKQIVYCVYEFVVCNSKDISEASGIFVDTVQNIQAQIREVSDVPGTQSVNSQDVLYKAKQTEETTEAMTVIVSRNKENANAISGIVKRFS